MQERGFSQKITYLCQPFEQRQHTHENKYIYKISIMTMILDALLLIVGMAIVMWGADKFTAADDGNFRVS
jgi:hypothetical protein